jgi:uncharacterized membrane protein
VNYAYRAGEGVVSSLIVVSFDAEKDALQVLSDLQSPRWQSFIDLEDAAVVTHDKKTHVKIVQSFDLVKAGAIAGGFWGLLIGLLLVNPVVGVLAGSVAGAIGGASVDIGISDDFIRDLGKSLKEGTSALFILAHEISLGELSKEVDAFHGKIIKTDLKISDKSEISRMILNEKENQNSAKI